MTAAPDTADITAEQPGGHHGALPWNDSMITAHPTGTDRRSAEKAFSAQSRSLQEAAAAARERSASKPLCSGLTTNWTPCNNRAAAAHRPMLWCGRCVGHLPVIQREIRYATARNYRERHAAAFAYPHTRVREVWAYTVRTEWLTDTQIRALAQDKINVLAEWFNGCRERGDEAPRPLLEAAVLRGSETLLRSLSGLFDETPRLAAEHPDLAAAAAFHPVSDVARSNGLRGRSTADSRPAMRGVSRRGAAATFTAAVAGDSVDGVDAVDALAKIVRGDPPGTLPSEAQAVLGGCVDAAERMLSSGKQPPVRIAAAAYAAMRIVRSANKALTKPPRHGIHRLPREALRPDLLRLLAAVSALTKRLPMDAHHNACIRDGWTRLRTRPPDGSPAAVSDSGPDTDGRHGLSAAAATLIIDGLEALPNWASWRRGDDCVRLAPLLDNAEDCAKTAAAIASLQSAVSRKKPALDAARALLANPAAGPDAAHALMRLRSPVMKQAVISADSERPAASRLLTDVDLARAAKSSDRHVAEAVAGNPHTAHEILSVLAASQYPAVRCTVAARRDLGSALLTLLAMDTDPDVAGTAARNLSRRSSGRSRAASGQAGR